LRPITNGAEVPVSMLTTVHAEAKRVAQARVEQAEAKLADAERAMTQLRDLCTDLEDVAQQMAEKVAAAQKEAQQAIGEAEHQSKLREQASAEVSQLQAALSDVQGTLSMRTEQLQSLEAQRQRELQQEAEQTAKAQAAAVHAERDKVEAEHELGRQRQQVAKLQAEVASGVRKRTDVEQRLSDEAMRERAHLLDTCSALKSQVLYKDRELIEMRSALDESAARSSHSIHGLQAELELKRAHIARLDLEGSTMRCELQALLAAVGATVERLESTLPPEARAELKKSSSGAHIQVRLQRSAELVDVQFTELGMQNQHLKALQAQLLQHEAACLEGSIGVLEVGLAESEQLTRQVCASLAHSQLAAQDAQQAAADAKRACRAIGLALDVIGRMAKSALSSKCAALQRLHAELVQLDQNDDMQLHQLELVLRACLGPLAAAALTPQAQPAVWQADKSLSRSSSPDAWSLDAEIDRLLSSASPSASPSGSEPAAAALVQQIRSIAADAAHGMAGVEAAIRCVDESAEARRAAATGRKTLITQLVKWLERVGKAAGTLRDADEARDELRRAQARLLHADAARSAALADGALKDEQLIEARKESAWLHEQLDARAAEAQRLEGKLEEFAQQAALKEVGAEAAESATSALRHELAEERRWRRELQQKLQELRGRDSVQRSAALSNELSAEHKASMALALEALTDEVGVGTVKSELVG
jgi:chromosome segregation ATPase